MNNNTGMPFKKRSNPIDSAVNPTPTEQPVKATPAKVVNDANREKYTATMEKDLRKRVKVASAMTGVQVSTFIEQACLEKLEREGR